MLREEEGWAVWHLVTGAERTGDEAGQDRAPRATVRKQDFGWSVTRSPWRNFRSRVRRYSAVLSRRVIEPDGVSES